MPLQGLPPADRRAGGRVGRLQRRARSPSRARRSGGARRSTSTRSFCADCGTPISYEHDELQGEIYIHAGLFDEADRLVPDRHAYVTSKLFWMHLEDGLDDPRGRRRPKARSGRRPGWTPSAPAYILADPPT